MYYGLNYKYILINYSNKLNRILIDYIIGKYNENEFKTYRLQHGVYRQFESYMWRIGIPYGKLNFFQILLLSYISLLYDKNYLHFTTRTNAQFNWIKIINIFEILKKVSKFLLNSSQTSGNCVRNITSSLNTKEFENEIWGELLRQWFNLNIEFLFLPRKFKIAILSSKKDDIVFKTHDMGINLKKNKSNILNIDILVGGGLGRTPIIGSYILKNVHWKNILNYSDKIIRIYNVYGIRKNIYKARLKILIKILNINNFISFILKEFNYSNYYIYYINEKELNFFFENDNIFFFKKKIFTKKIMFNIFFLNWLKRSFNKKNIYLPLKNYNSPPGDINFIQIKILFFFFNYFKYFKLFNRQNLIFTTFNNPYFLYLKLKRIFFNIYNFNLITDIVCCPGKDFCVLANAKSIIMCNVIQSIFINFKSLYKIGNLFLNISGCINSCGHHHVANIGILGVSKNNNDYYQIYTGGNFSDSYSLFFSKVLSSSFIYFKVSFFLIKILKDFLLKKKKTLK